jgi:hypothetical protein
VISRSVHASSRAIPASAARKLTIAKAVSAVHFRCGAISEVGARYCEVCFAHLLALEAATRRAARQPFAEQSNRPVLR